MEKNIKVVFANQKGGVGKSTLCILFADYLAWKGRSVCVIDTDLQKSVLMQRRKDAVAHSGQDEPYGVQDFDVAEPNAMRQLVDSASEVEGFVLFDTPGNVSQDGLFSLVRTSSSAPLTTKTRHLIPLEHLSPSLPPFASMWAICRPACSLFPIASILVWERKRNSGCGMRPQQCSLSMERCFRLFPHVPTCVVPIPSRSPLGSAATCATASRSCFGR